MRNSTTPQITRYVAGIIGAGAMLLAACGGSTAEDSSPGTGDEAPVTTQAAGSDVAGDQATTSPPTSAGASVSVGNGPGLATIQIDDITYEFTLDIVCLTMGGAISASGVAVDGSDVKVDAAIPPEGWETSGEDWPPPSVTIDDGPRDIRWVAGGDVGATFLEGSSQVDSFTSDGNVAVGEATFFNAYTFAGEAPTIATGQFELRCP